MAATDSPTPNARLPLPEFRFATVAGAISSALNSFDVTVAVAVSGSGSCLRDSKWVSWGLGASSISSGDLERNRAVTTERTINHLALIYAISSLPPDAPVSVLQDLILPPSVLRRQRAIKLVKGRQQAA